MKGTTSAKMLILGIVLVVCRAGLSQVAPMGTAFTYQGRLMDANEPANGIYEFQFKLYDLPEDGNQLDGTPAFRGVEVVDGYFTLQLDFGSDVFNGDARWLEISVRSGDNPSDPFTVLSPRQQVMPTPYALQTRGLFVDSALNVGIGTTSPAATLDVTNVGGQTAISAKSPWIGVYGIHNSTTGTFPGVWGDTDSLASGASGVRGKVTSTTPGSLSAGVWGMNAGTGSNGVGVRGTHDGSGRGVWGHTASPSGYAGYFTGGQNYFEGKVGIGTLTPGDLLQVSAETTGSLGIRITNTDAQGGDYALRVGGANSAIGAGSFAIYDHTGSASRLTITNAGRVGIGIVSPAADLDVKHKWGSIYAVFKATASDGSDLFYVGEHPLGHGYLALCDGSGKTQAFLTADVTGHSYVKGKFGVGTDYPTRKLTVRGNILVQSENSGTDVLELGEGLDYAEGFDVTDKVDTAPGTVLVIDPDNPGKLTVSHSAYDSKVAGIVAGGKGLGSGVRLGVGQFDYNVALAGRVYCNVDATENSVEPGDLLTTSATPGYAMKAVEYMRAQGAILGKAMERLEKGQKGQILVLVTLQ